MRDLNISFFAQLGLRSHSIYTVSLFLTDFA